VGLGSEPGEEGHDARVAEAQPGSAIAVVVDRRENDTREAGRGNGAVVGEPLDVEQAAVGIAADGTESAARSCGVRG
jgi:hypothetical protein